MKRTNWVACLGRCLLALAVAWACLGCTGGTQTKPASTEGNRPGGAGGGSGNPMHDTGGAPK